MKFEVKMKYAKKLELETTLANIANSSCEPLIFGAQPSQNGTAETTQHPDAIACQVKNKKLDLSKNLTNTYKKKTT